MEKYEAAIVMQDILFNFSGKFINSFVIAKSSDEYAAGYQISINGNISDFSMQKIRQIAEEYSLKVKENHELVIYDPVLELAAT